MLKTKPPIKEHDKLHFSTRALLLITTWAAICYSAVFSDHSLLLFHIARFFGVSAVVVLAVVPVFLKLEYRKFWNAFSIAIIAYLSYSFMHDFANPIVSEVTTIVCRMLGIGGYYAQEVYGVDYCVGQVGRFTAIYYLLEIHFVLLLGVLVGALWHNLNDQTTFWIVGAWGLYIAMDITSNYGLHLEFFSLLVVVFLLPAWINYEGRLRPFWAAFGSSAFLVGIEAVMSSGYDFTCYVNQLVALVRPLLPARIGESITFIAVPIAAAIVGGIVQAIVQKQGSATSRTGD